MVTMLRNALDYPLRQFFHWRRRGLQIRNEPKDRLFAHLPEEARPLAQAAADRLLSDYHLQSLYYHSRAENYCENLYYLELLEAALQRSRAALPAAVNAADIGPSHWFYVQALHALLKWWQPPTEQASLGEPMKGKPLLPETGRVVALSGFEADAYRVYLDLHSRYDHAWAHMRDLAGVAYVPGPFVQQPDTYHFITMLFPFVFLRDHLQWGLPRPMFAPEHLLAEAWASLTPGGLLIIVNQGEAEHAAQGDMLKAQGIPSVAAFCHESLLFRYDLLRYVLVARR